MFAYPPSCYRRCIHNFESNTNNNIKISIQTIISQSCTITIYVESMLHYNAHHSKSLPPRIQNEIWFTFILKRVNVCILNGRFTKVCHVVYALLDIILWIGILVLEDWWWIGGGGNIIYTQKWIQFIWVEFLLLEWNVIEIDYERRTSWYIHATNYAHTNGLNFTNTSYILPENKVSDTSDMWEEKLEVVYSNTRTDWAGMVLRLIWSSNSGRIQSNAVL